jgi:hypothetical protein
MPRPVAPAARASAREGIECRVSSVEGLGFDCGLGVGLVFFHLFCAFAVVLVCDSSQEETEKTEVSLIFTNSQRFGLGWRW